MNTEISILTLDSKDFENPVTKNSFIRTSKTEWLGFADESMTNKDEIYHILEENIFLLDYDVILFGANVPDGECVLFELLEYPQNVIYVLCFRKELLVHTGAYNQYITENSHYEMLLRLASRGSVYSIPCCGNRPPALHPTTLAYIMRRYMGALKEAGLLDKIFLHMMEAMSAHDKANDFKFAMSRFLDNPAEYDLITSDTAPILIMVADKKCYGVVAEFADIIADELVQLGQAVITTNDRYGDYSNIPTGKLLHQTYKAIIGFQSPALESETFSHAKGKRIQFWFDNPIFSADLFSKCSNDTLVLCHDGDYVRYIKEHFDVKNAIHFPLGGRTTTIQPEYYDLVFIGSYIALPQASYNDAFAKEFYQYMSAHPSCTVEEGIRALWQQKDIPYDEDRFLQQVESLRDVCFDLLQDYRHRVIEAIVEAGIKLHVFGDSWKKYKGAGAENLIHHPAVHSDDALQIWSQAKIGLNIMNGHKAGMTERIANIMLCGACCLSDETRYLTEHFENGREIVLFNADELEHLPDKIRYLLEHDDKRRAIAQLGQTKAKQAYTWQKRTAELLAIIESDEYH